MDSCIRTIRSYCLSRFLGEAIVIDSLRALYIGILDLEGTAMQSYTYRDTETAPVSSVGLSLLLGKPA